MPDRRISNRNRTNTMLFCTLMLLSSSTIAVDDTPLLHAHEDHDNWLTYGHGYANQRYSALDQIDTGNIGRLVPKWIYQTGVLGTFPTSPIVADGVMYFSTPYNHVVALDAATGKLRWRYTHEMATDKLCCGSHNRGIAIGYGRLYMITADARLLAIDRRDGAVVWDIPVVDPATGEPLDIDRLGTLEATDPEALTKLTRFAGNMAPVVYDGKVFVGVSGAGYTAVLGDAEAGSTGRLGRPGIRRGQRAFLSAYEAASGRLVWRWYATAAVGWEGGFVERTAFGDLLHRDIVAERANAPDYRDAWKTGGGSIYSSPSIDPDLGLIYFGTGNAAPPYAPDTRPGDNLYTASLIALDVKTGALRWHHQITPHDIWGYDVAAPPVLLDFRSGGKTVRAVAQASKSGWLYVFDRGTGEALRRSEPFVPQNENMFHPPTADGLVAAPGAAGGANWPPSSYSPLTRWLYVSGTHYPTRYALEKDDAGNTLFTLDFPEGGERSGTFSAIDPADGRIKWQVKTDLPVMSGSIATGGGLIFHGESNGNFVARDDHSGEVLWHFNTGAGVNAPPVAYTVDGRQYIAVAAGGHRLFEFPVGDAVIAFGLPDRKN
jgi:PQQ-dependent dehydrogenase (methanol/ethanol family)